MRALISELTAGTTIGILGVLVTIAMVLLALRALGYFVTKYRSRAAAIDEWHALVFGNIAAGELADYPRPRGRYVI